MKTVFWVVGGVLFLFGILFAFDFYRDMQTAKTVMKEFKPSLLPIKDLASLDLDERKAYDMCLEGKLAEKANANNEETFCRCYAVGFVRHLSSLLSPNGDQRLAVLKNLGEVGAKNAVIMKTCADH